MRITEHEKEINSYVRAVISGKVKASRHLRAACKRYLHDKATAAGRGLVLNKDRANKVIDFMEQLTHTKGKWAGQPFRLDVLQKFIVWNIFGWQVKATGLRRFNHAYITVARKWGKSTFASALAIALLFFDQPIEAEAEGYVVATKEDQAARIVTQADKMIQGNPTLQELARPFRFRDKTVSIILEGRPYNGSVLKALGSDSRTADSLNPHFVIKDELHEWREHHRDLKEKLETGSGSRDQPLDVIITTAGDDQSQLWIEHDEYCQRILESFDSDAPIGDNTLVIICRLEEARPCGCGGLDDSCDCVNGEIPGDDMYDESNWIKANPNIGQTPKLEYMRELAEKAKNSPGFKSAFERYHANRKVRANMKIINPNTWSACRGHLSRWTGNCFGAWDIGFRDDLASIAAVADINGRYEVRQLSFCPEDGNRDLNRHPWNQWIDEGRLIATPGNTTDLTLMQETIVEWTEQYGVTDWSFDRNNSRQMATDLLNEHGIECFEFNQSYQMYNEPMRELVRVLNTGRFVHDGDGLLTWAIGNLVAKVGRGGDWMPDKLKSPDKIDPAVALLMAFGRCLLSEPSKPSVYSRRGVIAV